MKRLVCVVAAVVTLVTASSANAAAPTYIMVSGPGIARPIVLDDWNENHVFLISLVDAPRAKGIVFKSLTRRPRFHLAEFWGWQGLPRPSDPREANQHGWFYPARGTQAAVIDVMVGGVRVPRLAPRAALRILARHGVPTRVRAG